MTTEPPPLPPAQSPPHPSGPPSALPTVMIVIGALLLVVFIIAALAGMTAPVLLRMRKKGDLVVAMNNGRSLALMMNDFHSEYGSYPDRDTAKLLSSRKPHGLDLSGDSSNNYFRQLIAAGIAKSEHPFFAKSAFAKHAPDNSISGTRVLAPGEVGWGYVMNGGSSLPDTSPDIPLCVTPLRPGQPGKFDPAPFQRKAAVVHPDCSVKLLTIQPDGRVATDNGRILMETGPGSIWPAGVNPVIKSPAMRKP